LGNATSDSAFVHASHAMMAQSRHVGPGSNELVQELEDFTAAIAINRDTSDT
jgi:hypothetical protein